MGNSLIQMVGAILMVLVVGGLIVTWWNYQARNSERRRMSMLESLGLDPAIASGRDLPTIMNDVRQRCEHCQSEDMCERWLRGEVAGDNEFCPNARVFEILRKYSKAAG